MRYPWMSRIASFDLLKLGTNTTFKYFFKWLVITYNRSDRSTTKLQSDTPKQSYRRLDEVGRTFEIAQSYRSQRVAESTLSFAEKLKL